MLNIPDGTGDSMEQKSDYLRTLEAAVFVAHNCWPIHRGTCFVWEETEDNAVVWAGPVELFSLPDHEKAKNCYAWQHKDDDGHPKVFAVLQTRFINSAKKAVEAAIFADVQPVPRHTYTLELFKKHLVEADRTLYDAQIKTQNLDASVQSVKNAMDKINDRLASLTLQHRELRGVNFPENE